MTSKEFHTRKREMEIAKDYQEFFHRIRMNTWTQSTVDVSLRLEALIQFHPTHSTRQILNRSQLFRIP